MEYTIRKKQYPQSGWFIGQCEEIPEALGTNTVVRKLILGNEKKFVDKTLGRKELCTVLGIPKPKIN